MSNPPALDDVDICGPLVPSITDMESSYLHQHVYQRQVEQLLLSGGSSGHASAPDTGQALTWSHQEPHFQQEAVLQLQAAADSISAGNMHGTMAEYLAHMTAAASGGDACGQGITRDSVQMQIPMSELMAHVTPGDGEDVAAVAAAADGGGTLVGQMLLPSKQLQYSGQQGHQGSAPPMQLMPEGVQMQMQVGAEGAVALVPPPLARTLPAAKECPGCHHWKPGSEFLKIARSADGLAHKCKACAMKASGGPTLAAKACSKCKEMKSKDAFCINKYMADGMQSQCKVCAKAGRKKVSSPQVSEKACKSCGISRPASEFHQDKRNPDGLHMHCKICRKRKGAPPTAGEEAVTEKACSRCQLVKGASSFYVDRQAQSGLEDQCKECRRANRRLVTEVTVSSKPCAKCHTTKPAGDFYHDKRAGDGLQSYCKICMKLRSEHTEDTTLRKRRNASLLLPGDVAGQGLCEGMAGAEERHSQQHDLLMQQHVAASGAAEEDVQIPMSELMAQEDAPNDAPDGSGEHVSVD